MQEEDDLPPSVWYKEMDNGVVLRLFIQPGARCNEVIGIVGDALKLKIAAPSIEDKANIELVRFLSALLKLPRSQIKIKRGLKSRHKIIEVVGCGSDRLCGLGVVQ